MKVAFEGGFSKTLVEAVRQRLSIPCEIIAGDEDALLAELSDVEVLVSMAFSSRIAEAAPSLRLVQVPGAGLDRVDTSALGPRVALANVHGHGSGIAEYVIGAMIALTREFTLVDQSLRRGVWESQWAVGRAIPPVRPELSGKTLAVIGLGHIGEEVVRRAAAFDMTIVAVRRDPAAPKPPGVSHAVGLDRIDEALGRADYVVITLPLVDATARLFDTKRFQAMKPSAYLINVARGGIVDEDALYNALHERRIAGAAIDVWYRYPVSGDPTPPSRLPFHELDNVIMTPHVSGWTDGMLAARAALIAENIERTARGEAPLNAVELDR
jgi:phosphoglycerate dehydrogenase-like enzyme